MQSQTSEARPFNAFALPPKGEEDGYAGERNGVLADALYLATAAADRDPAVRAARERMNALTERVRRLEGGSRDGAEDHLWFEIDSEAGNLFTATAYAVAYAWLRDRGSVPLDLAALDAHYAEHSKS